MDGSGLAGVKINRAFASYAGTIVATTNQEGYYQSDFQSIPGDEMIRVWAELGGYAFEPASQTTWNQGFYYWRHYYGSEETTLNFIAKPIR